LNQASSNLAALNLAALNLAAVDTPSTPRRAPVSAGEQVIMPSR